jgi:hypothetical protein
VFLPLWVFHGTVSRGRFSLPAPSPPHDRHVRSTLLPSCNGFIVELICSMLHGPGFEENRDFYSAQTSEFKSRIHFGSMRAYIHSMITFCSGVESLKAYLLTFTILFLMLCSGLRATLWSQFH